MKKLIAQFLREKGFNVPEDYMEDVIRNIARSNNKSVEGFFKELYEEGLTPDDLKEVLKLEILSTAGLREFLSRSIEISEIEIELERLKKGEIRLRRTIQIITIPKSKQEELLRAFDESQGDIQKLSQILNVPLETLSVFKGDLVKELDKEVWRSSVGDLVFAETKDTIYIAKILKQERVISGRSEQEIKNLIFQRKLLSKMKELIEELKRDALVEIYYDEFKDSKI